MDIQKEKNLMMIVMLTCGGWGGVTEISGQ